MKYLQFVYLGLFYGAARCFAAASPITGTTADEELDGTDKSDVFDSSAGGKDKLRGRAGDDVYMLGAGTGEDVIIEHYNNETGDDNDRIKVKSGYTPANTRLRRSDDGDDLIVELLGENDAVTDFLRVENHYTDSSAKIERVEFTDSDTVWTADDFALARITGDDGDNELEGERKLDDVFDSAAGGNDTLYGYGGNDVYWLGKGTGKDVIREYYRNSGDDADKIKIKSGYTPANTRLRRSADGDDLVVELLDENDAVTDSLKVEDYYQDESAKIERVEFTDSDTVWTADDLAAAKIIGDEKDNSIHGVSDVSDVFDADAGGNDTLYGYSGNDVYWLGARTGHDVIREYEDNSGDDGDKIKIKSGYAPDKVRLQRSDDGDHLIVQLLNDDDTVSNSLKVENYYTDASAKVESVEFADSAIIWDAAVLDAAEITGGAGDDKLEGEADFSDVFDSDGGGNDTLHGYSGDDVYWLGAGTGRDVIREHADNSGDDGDKIRIKSGYAPGDVRLRRSDDGDDLFVELAGDNGVTDSLTVENYYTDASAKVESVEFADSAIIWDAAVLDAAEITGGAGDDKLEGEADFTDVFDSDGGGNDTLHGYSGNDVYWLGAGTGRDVIREHADNSGDDGDKIRIKSGYAPGDVRLLRSNNGSDLYVELLNARGMVTDSLKVENYYTDPSARVESVEFSDSMGTVWNAAVLTAAKEVKGAAGSDNLTGKQNSNDTLYGYGGNDVYSLSAGVGHDVIREHADNSGDDGDKIKVEGGTGNVRLLGSHNREDLIVQLLNAAGEVTDSLTVEHHFTDPSAAVESIVFTDGTIWGADVLALTEITGTAGDDSSLEGSKNAGDIFDADAGGNDDLYGKSGNDVYQLGAGTGLDSIHEYYKNKSGDSGDMIRVESGYAPGDVRLRRSDEGDDLLVELLNGANAVKDSLTVKNYYTKDEAKIEIVEFSDGTVWGADDFAAAEITGDADANELKGKKNMSDVFDSDFGSNDTLYGYSGGDVYRLGAGTGHDTIAEYSGNSGDGDADDKIKIKSGYGAEDVLLLRSNDGNDLYVALLNEAGAVTDSLTVEDYYKKDAAKIESVEFSDGVTVWGADDFAAAEITGGAANDKLQGKQDMNDVFDSDGGGKDILYGYSGDDVYWLGAGTGDDIIAEYRKNSGDARDTIRIKSGYGAKDVSLLRSKDGEDLHVQLLGADGAATDSLTVRDYYTKDAAKVESVEFEDGTVWNLEELTAKEILGSSKADSLTGRQNADDILHGGGGNDTYWLGAGAGHDVIREHRGNSGDADDKIRINNGYKPADVRLLRSRDGKDLLVQLLNVAGDVTDSLTVDRYYTDDSAKVESIVFADGTAWNANVLTAAGEIKGAAGGDNLPGKQNSNDTLYGYGGNDVYWLGAGSGHDVIREHADNSGDAEDKIKIKSAHGAGDVRLLRSGDGKDLHVLLLDDSGAVTDSLTVEYYFADASAKIESIEFAGGAKTWNANDIAAAAVIAGGADNDSLYGESDLNNVFDSDAGGNDILYGYSGDDVYWLGAGTGHDVAREHAGNDSGDANDKIKIKSGYGPSDVRLLRAGGDLLVQLLDDEGVVTDSIKVERYFTDASAKVESVEFADSATVWDANALNLAGEIKGTAGNDNLPGRQNSNDTLYGYGGNDVYWLGAGTGHDVIREHYDNYGDAGDKIKLKSGYKPADVRLRRVHADSGEPHYSNHYGSHHLLVELLDDKGLVTDSLTVERHYTDASARIERIEFADGTAWTAKDFALAEIAGGAGDDSLYGLQNVSDVFDADAGGNDVLYGKSGNDVYWLGAGTDHDVIREHYGNWAHSDADDKIKIKSGAALADVRLLRSGGDLLVQLLDGDGEVTDSLTVERHFIQRAGKIESIEAAGHVLRENQYQGLIDEIAAFTAGTSSYDSLTAVHAHYWEEDTTLSSSNG